MQKPKLLKIKKLKECIRDLFDEWIEQIEIELKVDDVLKILQIEIEAVLMNSKNVKCLGQNQISVEIWMNV